LHCHALTHLTLVVVAGPLENIFNKTFEFTVHNKAYPRSTLKTAESGLIRKTYLKYKPVCIISSKAYYSTLPKSDLAVFPTDTSVTYENPLKSRHDICFNYKNFRGCYLWTSKTTGKQYIGSSINLSLRLTEYFRKSYLTLQSGRGSIICRAILKYGQDDFYLSILSLGSLEDKDTKYSSDNLPDFVVLEQSYLDNHKMEYNVNRVASTKYESLYVSVNKGEANPSYNLIGEEAFVWNRNHSAELKAHWSRSRGKITYYIYSKDSFELNIILLSSNKLAAFLKVHAVIVKQMTELIESSEHSAIRCEDYIISLKPLNCKNLANNLDVLLNFEINSSKTRDRKLAAEELKKGRKGLTIYGFNPETHEYKIWPSKGECLEELTGYYYTNVRTINRRIDKDLKYKGYYLQTKPFKENT